MSSTRLVAIAILSTSLTACDPGMTETHLRSLLQALQSLGYQESSSDPFTGFFQRDTQGRDSRDRHFDDTWPPGLPTPSGRGDFPDGFMYDQGANGDEMTGEWITSSGDADDYGDRLGAAGYGRQSQTTETDPATGWPTTTSTYQNSSGQTVEVTSTDRSTGFSEVTVTVNPGS